MKKNFLVFVVFALMLPVHGQNADSTHKKMSASANISINSNGINPIPAFSLGKPAVLASVSITKGRFSYDPGLAYGLDAKPWYIDNWLHYLIVNRKVFKLRTGINFSTFFSEKILPDEKFLQAQRYLTGEIAGIFSLSERASITVLYWNDNGQDHGTLTGGYYSISAEVNSVRLGDTFSLSASLQLFYLSYEGNNDGLFTSPRIAFNETHLPFTLYFQATQPISSNIEPAPAFAWNVGLAYNF